MIELGSVLFYDLKVGDKYTVGPSPQVFTKIDPGNSSWKAGGNLHYGKIPQSQPVDRVMPDSDFTSAYTDAIGDYITGFKPMNISTNVSGDWTVKEAMSDARWRYMCLSQQQTNKETKMNKVYEGILVKVEDGEMTDAYSVETTLAGSPQRARDNFVREFGDTITDLEDNGFDWDIIVREFK